MYDERTIVGYIREVRKQNLLQDELERIQGLMLESTIHPHENPEQQQVNVACQNRLFKALLTEKARQEAIQQMSQNNSSASKDSGTGPTDDTPRSIRIRHILEQEVSRG